MPVGVLVETQHLASKRHAECAEQEYDSRDPSHLARVFESAEEKNLNQVGQHDRDHEV
jgi:hypothetical protein